jgi:hypothetical protein
MMLSKFSGGPALSRWLFSLFLFAPVVAFYAAPFVGAGHAFTGFITYDTPYYMANARAHWADGTFTLTYGLPFSSDPLTPKIYFQPLILLLGLAEHLTGADPGIVFDAAEMVIALLCMRVIVALYETIVGPPDSAARLIGLVCFAWGGGVVVLASLLWGRSFEDWARGWWFFNLGRNVILPTEAFYHVLFLGSILLAARRRFAGA